MPEGNSIMYLPFRHDANVKESMLNGSASTLLDSGSSARPFASSGYSAQSGTPFAHHGGNLQGLHNAQASYNMQSVQNSVSSRNQGLGGNPSSGGHQSTGNLQGGRFTSNNKPVDFSQQSSHGSLHGQSAMTSRAGIIAAGNHSFSNSMNGIGRLGSGGSLGSNIIGSRGSFSGLGGGTLQMGASGPRISSTVGSIGGGGSLSGGGGLSRSLNAAVQLNAASLGGARVNMSSLNNSGGISVQGLGRPVNSMLQQGVNMSSSYNPSGDLLAMISRASPRAVSLLGSNFSSSPGLSTQGQGQLTNGQLGSHGLSNDSSDGVPFDINDFPQLTARQSGTSGLQGSAAALKKQGVAVNANVQHNQGFSIQSEDFPALSACKDGGNDSTTELQHHKEQHEDSLASAMQSQHFTHQTGGLGSGSVSASELQHLQASMTDSFSSSHVPSPSYQSQIPGASQIGTGGGHLQRSGSLASYDQLLQQYHQAQLRAGGAGIQQQQFAQLARESIKGFQQGGMATPQDRFGLLGLLSVIRMSDPDLTTLALGTDLTTLGLNLNSRENLYKTFASPWADGPVRGEPEFTLPDCYVQRAPRLQPGYFSKFPQETLFYIFYSMPNDEAQMYAADELYNRGWFYHKDHKIWLTRVLNEIPPVTTQTFERGAYYFFDHNTWDTGRKENFVLQYEHIEKRPQLPSQVK
ncbi:probable NOT transcription complex subunit VIP2 isoform X2 [Physcomitrium patens]|uniref:probable NOT transcription complex subunit VIP2 isoform X2 n=1 Tax=Physcomitrium patens TaxID=3218 RepID=UPI000D15C213|nr:probable NOT transcription complex subunit VIP2 isoform X2 [Physcomitrium patens]|eukprot:XP_024362821.1 probable NOT transcription complex subunit VIP2 isoform X2 [Physcomitrella patens]